MAATLAASALGRSGIGKIAQIAGSQAATSGIASGGLLSALGGPLGIGLFAGQIGIQLLFKRIFAPDLEPLPVKTHTLSGGREQARWCFGERRFPLEWTDGTSLPNPRFIDNHIRLIGCVSMDPCEAVATSIWLNQDPFALRVDPEEAGALIPPVGSDYILRPGDVREYSFPTKYALTVRPKLLADGTQWGTTAGTATGRNAYAPPEPGDDTRREYNGRGGSETSWGATRTNATTRVRDWVQTCNEGYTYDPDQDLCVNDDDPSLTETAREVIIREFDIGLEVKVIDASYKLMGIAGVQVDAFQPFFQQAGTRLAREQPDTAKRLYRGIPDIDVRLKGKKITWPGQATPKWTANPVAILFWLDTVYRGIPASAIDETEFAAAYAACEEMLTYRYGAATPSASLGADGEWYVKSDLTVWRKSSGAWMQEGTTQGDYEWFSGRGTGGVVQIPRYQCHIEIESGQRISDIYARILASCAGARFEWQDRIRYRVGIRRAVSLRVLEQDVIAFESVVPITDLGARINKYTARMTQSEQNDWLPDTVAYEDSAARARDGELRTTEYTLDAVTDPIQASNITSVMLRQGRVNGAWVVRVGYFPMMEQADAATYDIWEITHRALGLDRQRVEVQWARVQPDGTVVALVHEHPTGTYDPVLALPDLPQRVLKFGVAPVPAVQGLKASSHATKLAAGSIVNHLTATCDASETFETRFEYRPTPASEAGEPEDGGWLPMAFAEQRAEVSPVIGGNSYDVRAFHADASRGYGPPSQITYVVPRFLTPEGVAIWVGEGPPNNELGEDGDIYLEQGGNRWYKRGGVWVDSGVPVSGVQGFVTFEASASESVPRPYPTVTAPDGTVAYNLVTGQVWERRGGVWVYKADLTGPPGQPGAGIAAWNADRPPTAEDGMDGDIWRLNTGVWYRKVDGAWVVQSGTIGRSGTRVIPIDGEGPPLRPDTFTPPAENGDLAFAAGSLRFYELQAGSWIEIADLSPQRTYVYTAAQEVAPTPATLPEINATGAERVRTGDEARNQRTGEIWRAARSGSTVTWVLVGDATLKGGFTVGSADPPPNDGIVYGEVYVSTSTDKRYVWTRKSAGAGEWIHDGYVHASEWIFSDALPAQGERTPGDIYVIDNDIYCINDDLSATLCGTLTGDPEPSDPNYLVPGDCTVFFTHSEYGKPNHVGKINDGWLDASGRYGTKASSATDTGGTWPTAKQLPGAAPLIIRTAADPDDILPPRYVGPSRLFAGTLYHVITAGDDIGEVWKWNPMTRRNEQPNPPILLCGVARITAGTVTPPTFTDRNVSMTVRSNGTVTAGLQWTGGVGTGFHVRYREVGGDWLPVTEITQDDGTKRNVRYHIIVTVLGFLARSYAVTGLKPSTRYEFAVRTVGASSQTSRWVQASRVSSAIPRPAAPTRVTGAESTIVDGRVNVDWVRPSSWARAQITSITVELYRGNPVSTSSVSPVASTVASGTADSAVFSDVRAGGYTAHVYATNPSGDGPVRRSTQFSVVRNPTAPPPSAPLLTPWSPTGFFVTIQTPHSARLEWDTYKHRPNGRATYLEWRYGTAILARTSPAYQAMSAWATAGAPVGSGTGIGGRFQENVLYRFQLRAVNASGASAAANFNPRWSGD